MLTIFQNCVCFFLQWSGQTTCVALCKVCMTHIIYVTATHTAWSLFAILLNLRREPILATTVTNRVRFQTESLVFPFKRYLGPPNLKCNLLPNHKSCYFSTTFSLPHSSSFFPGLRFFIVIHANGAKKIRTDRFLPHPCQLVFIFILSWVIRAQSTKGWTTGIRSPEGAGSFSSLLFPVRLLTPRDFSWE